MTIMGSESCSSGAYRILKISELVGSMDARLLCATTSLVRTRLRRKTKDIWELFEAQLEFHRA